MLYNNSVMNIENEIKYRIEQLKHTTDVDPQVIKDLFSLFITNSKQKKELEGGAIHFIKNTSGDNDSGGALIYDGKINGKECKAGDITVYDQYIEYIVSEFNKVSRQNPGLAAIAPVLSLIICFCEHEVEHLVQREVALGKRVDPHALQYAKEFIVSRVARKDIYNPNRHSFAIEQGAEIAGFHGTVEELQRFLPEAVEWYRESPTEFLKTPFGKGRITIVDTIAPANIAITQVTDHFFGRSPELMESFPALKREYNSDGTKKSKAELVADRNAWAIELERSGEDKNIVTSLGNSSNTLYAVKHMYDNIFDATPELYRNNDISKDK